MTAVTGLPEPSISDVAAAGAPRGAPLLGAAGLKIRIAFFSLLVLLVGAFTAPPVTPTTIAPPAERAAPLLSEQVEQRAVGESFRRLQALAAQVRGQSLAVPAIMVGDPPTRWDYARPPDPDAPPAGFGVHVEATGHVLTHAAALGGRSTVELSTSSGAVATGTLIAFEPTSGLALLRVAESGGIPSTALSASLPEPGTLVLAAAEWNGAALAVPVYVTRVGRGRLAVAGGSNDMAPGTPVYDADGALAAIIGADPAVAYDARRAIERLTTAAAAGAGFVSAVGVGLQPLTPSLTAVFGDEGVLVSDLLPGGPAAAAGLEPGDVLLRIGTVPVTTAEEVRTAIRAAPVGASLEFHLRRAGRDVTLAVTTASTFAVAATAASLPPSPPEGIDLRALAAVPLLAAVDLPPEARVLQVNGRPATSLAQVRQALRRRGPTVLHLADEGRRYFHVVEPQP
jgi:S1-C subfamily serine protease